MSKVKKDFVMSKIEKFEDLVIWQSALDIAVQIYKLSLNDSLRREWVSEIRLSAPLYR